MQCPVCLEEVVRPPVHILGCRGLALWCMQLVVLWTYIYLRLRVLAIRIISLGYNFKSSISDGTKGSPTVSSGEDIVGSSNLGSEQRFIVESIAEGCLPNECFLLLDSDD